MNKIIVFTIALGTAPLIAINIVQLIIEKIIRVNADIKDEYNVRYNGVFMVQFLVDVLFFVVIPTLVYYWLYPVLPFVGYKAGIAVGIAAYILGSLPYAIQLSLRIRIPAILVVTTLFFNLIKLSAALGVITYYLNY